MALHHIVGIVATALGIYTGYGLSGMVNLLLIMEISTPPLNYRSLYDKKDLGKPIPTALQITFFILFFVFRVILMPYAYYKMWSMKPLIWDVLSEDRKLAFMAAGLVFGATFILNYYWFGLML